MANLENYRTRFVNLKLAYLDLLVRPVQSPASAAITHERLSAINDDLLQLAEELLRAIKVMQKLPLTWSESQAGMPAYQQLLLDANNLAQRLAVSLRQTQRFIYDPRPPVSTSPIRSNSASLRKL